ncbi:MAG: cation:proton antiporter [Leptospiraceae bacterium]|nr:cation:proton antiporter [Leptospiraceae bacterium]MBK7054287.1 cation:proton antiporter [Leptospiraceae bacterium]MBK9499591.1 cation:proton antiporter [Leptospiraceae bacterium]MBL0266199.1 cation:proton antiporter [Leptospiraceae bacterium]MBP9163622.1 cation:proton antiporter [Leptospiraceae bacterium]
MGLAGDIVIIILAGLITGFIAHKLNLPLILGYIVAGIIIGPNTNGITVSNLVEIELLAEIGVALLLFSIGLDISFQEIVEVRMIALVGTPIQIALCIFYGYWIGKILGYNWTSSIVLGGIISLSSTMVVMKTLMSRNLMGTLSARVMLGILIVQDLAAVPMMIMVPQLEHLTESFSLLGMIIVKVILLLVGILVFGIKIIPAILGKVARLHSRELFILSVMALGLGIGFLTYALGLSFALGAFITGIVLSESEYSHKAMNDLVPLRDIFGLIFFTSIGMLFDPNFLLANWKIIFIIVSLVLLGKFLIFAVISRAFGYFNIVPLAVGLGLAQIGEFSFVLAKLGLNEGILSKEIFSVILSTSVLTMFVSPFLLILTTPFYKIKLKFVKSKSIQLVNIQEERLTDHIIIAGGGRIGINIGYFLQQLEYKFVFIENNYKRFEKLKTKGFPAIFGDSSQESAMHAANITMAKLLIITVPSLSVTKEMIQSIKNISLKLKIIARSNTLEEVEEINKLEVFDVVQPEFEASLEILRLSSLHLGFSANTIRNYFDAERSKHQA